MTDLTELVEQARKAADLLDKTEILTWTATSCRTVADAIEALAKENATLKRTYDDLYADALHDAKSDAQDFDGDLWKVVRDYLDSLDFDWTEHVHDGVTADCAIEFIRESMDDETRRANRAEAEIATLKARAEAAEAKVARDSDLILDAYKAILVLHRILDKIGLDAGTRAAHQIADRIVAAHPEVIGRAALREIGDGNG